MWDTLTLELLACLWCGCMQLQKLPLPFPMDVPGGWHRAAKPSVSPPGQGQGSG